MNDLDAFINGLYPTEKLGSAELDALSLEELEAVLLHELDKAASENEEKRPKSIMHDEKFQGRLTGGILGTYGAIGGAAVGADMARGNPRRGALLGAAALGVPAYLGGRALGRWAAKKQREHDQAVAEMNAEAMLRHKRSSEVVSYEGRPTSDFTTWPPAARGTKSVPQKTAGMTDDEQERGLGKAIRHASVSKADPEQKRALLKGLRKAVESELEEGDPVDLAKSAAAGAAARRAASDLFSASKGVSPFSGLGKAVSKRRPLPPPVPGGRGTLEHHIMATTPGATMDQARAVAPLMAKHLPGAGLQHPVWKTAGMPQAALTAHLKQLREATMAKRTADAAAKAQRMAKPSVAANVLRQGFKTAALRRG